MRGTHQTRFKTQLLENLTLEETAWSNLMHGVEVLDVFPALVPEKRKVLMLVLCKLGSQNLLSD